MRSKGVLSLLLPCWCFVPVVFAAEELKPAVAGCVGYGITQKGWEKTFNHVLCIAEWKNMEPEPGNYEPGFPAPAPKSKFLSVVSVSVSVSATSAPGNIFATTHHKSCHLRA